MPRAALPLDIFVVTAREPAQVMAEFARLTGHPEMPPLWALGYQQSHRTLADRAEVLSIARTFREKKLPCDVLIYLGTGFCPSGWNTGHGSFTFNPAVFPDPKAMIDELHAAPFSRRAARRDPLQVACRNASRMVFDKARLDEQNAASYWNAHRGVFALGVDGWWPDEGDALDVASRLARIRMYYEGSLVGPAERAALRPAPQRLRRDAALRGVPLVGRRLLDLGDARGPMSRSRSTPHSRAFPTGAPTPAALFPPRTSRASSTCAGFSSAHSARSFARTDGPGSCGCPGDGIPASSGPNEIRTYGDAANPGPAELHNAAVEPICRKYLELRYRLLPYLYSVVRECCLTGLPIIRALWLHYPDDPAACARGDQYLFGPIILVAPVTEKGATSRRLYLPRGLWYDFWTGEAVEGGKEISRPVDLATLPLYVRAGSILPLGPVKQYTSEPVDGPLTLRSLSRRIWPFSTLRGRRSQLFLHQGRLDGDRPWLGRSGPRA